MSDLSKQLQEEREERLAAGWTWGLVAIIFVLIASTGLGWKHELEEQARLEAAMPTQINGETLKRLDGKACHPAPGSHSGCFVVDKYGAMFLLNAHYMGFEGGRMELRLRAIALAHKDPTNVYAGDQITFEELQKRFKKVVFRDDPDYAWYAEGYFTRQSR